MGKLPGGYQHLDLEGFPTWFQRHAISNSSAENAMPNDVSHVTNESGNWIGCLLQGVFRHIKCRYGNHGDFL